MFPPLEKVSAPSYSEAGQHSQRGAVGAAEVGVTLPLPGVLPRAHGLEPCGGEVVYGA